MWRLVVIYTTAITSVSGHSDENALLQTKSSVLEHSSATAVRESTGDVILPLAQHREVRSQAFDKGTGTGWSAWDAEAKFISSVSTWMHSELSYRDYTEAEHESEVRYRDYTEAEHDSGEYMEDSGPRTEKTKLSEKTVTPIPVVQSIEAVVEMVFRVPEKSVTPQMIEDLWSRHQNHCSVVQVIDNRVYMLQKSLSRGWHNGRLLDLVYLLQLATQQSALPDVEMLVCTTDTGVNTFEHDTFFNRVPVLAPWADMRNNGSVPVPMLARSEKSFWRAGWVQNLMAGRPDTKASRQVAWAQKQSKAFFRGGLLKHVCRCNTSYQARGGSCLRHRLIERLGADSDFDVRSSSHGDDCGLVPNQVREDEWEDFKYILIVGNAMGWADRTMTALFKSSVAFYVDSEAFEWFYPLLEPRKHFLRADPDEVSVKKEVTWALEHDESTSAIVPMMNRFAKDTFTMENIVRYVGLVATAYSKTLSYVPKRRTGLPEHPASGMEQYPFVDIFDGVPLPKLWGGGHVE